MLTSFSAFIAACILGRWGDAACFRVRFNLLIARLVTARRFLTARFVVVACRRLLTVFLGLRGGGLPHVLFFCFMLLILFLLLVVVSQ